MGEESIEKAENEEQQTLDENKEGSDMEDNLVKNDVSLPLGKDCNGKENSTSECVNVIEIQGVSVKEDIFKENTTFEQDVLEEENTAVEEITDKPDTVIAPLKEISNEALLEKEINHGKEDNTTNKQNVIDDNLIDLPM